MDFSGNQNFSVRPPMLPTIFIWRGLNLKPCVKSTNYVSVFNVLRMKKKKRSAQKASHEHKMWRQFVQVRKRTRHTSIPATHTHTNFAEGENVNDLKSELELVAYWRTFSLGDSTLRSNMDEISRGLDEVALGSSENNNVLQSLEEGRHTAVEACGCAELERNESVGAFTT